MKRPRRALLLYHTALVPLLWLSGCACGPCKGPEEEPPEQKPIRAPETSGEQKEGFGAWSDFELKDRIKAQGWKVAGECEARAEGAPDGITCQIEREGFEGQVTLARFAGIKTAREATADIRSEEAAQRDGATLLKVKVGVGDAARDLRDALIGDKDTTRVNLSELVIRDIQVGIHGSGWKARGKCTKESQLPMVEWTCELEKAGAEATVRFTTVEGAPHEVRKGTQDGPEASVDQGDAALKVRVEAGGVAEKLLDALVE